MIFDSLCVRGAHSLFFPMPYSFFQFIHSTCVYLCQWIGRYTLLLWPLSRFNFLGSVRRYLNVESMISLTMSVYKKSWIHIYHFPNGEYLWLFYTNSIKSHVWIIQLTWIKSIASKTEISKSIITICHQVRTLIEY